MRTAARDTDRTPNRLQRKAQNSPQGKKKEGYFEKEGMELLRHI